MLIYIQLQKRDLTLRALVQGRLYFYLFIFAYYFLGQSYISIKVEHAKHKEQAKRISGLNLCELSQSQQNSLCVGSELMRELMKNDL